MGAPREVLALLQERRGAVTGESPITSWRNLIASSPPLVPRSLCMRDEGVEKSVFRGAHFRRIKLISVRGPRSNGRARCVCRSALAIRARFPSSFWIEHIYILHFFFYMFSSFGGIRNRRLKCNVLFSFFFLRRLLFIVFVLSRSALLRK